MNNNPPKPRDKAKAIHPRCGKKYPSGYGAWTPALIKKHERGCSQCQSKLEAQNSRSQSDYQRSKRIRERLEEFYFEAPFESED